MADDKPDNPGGIGVPPPLTYFLPLAAGLLASAAAPDRLLPDRAARLAGWPLLGSGATLAWWFARTMREAGTPFRPDEPVEGLSASGSLMVDLPDVRRSRGSTARVGAPVRCLIWDFDGTLAYHRRGMWSGSMLHCLSEAAPDLPVSREDLRPHLRTGFPWHEPARAHPELDSPRKWWEALSPVLERAFVAVGAEPDLGRELAARVREDFVDPEQWSLFPDVLPALDRLSSRGWIHLVLSNHVPELPDIARGLGLGDRLHRVFNSAEIGFEKPHPGAFRAVLGAIRGAEEVWMVGDNAEADVAGAKAAGIPAILVRRPREGIEPYCEDLAGVAAVVDGRP